MKTIVPLLLAVAVGAFWGCSKSTDTSESSGTKAASGLSDTAKQAEAAVKDAAKDVGQAVTKAANEASESVSSAYKDAMAKAQSLLKESKFEGALDSLKQLSNLKLTPEQQKAVDDLRAQIEKAWAASKAAGQKAGDAAKNLLPK